MSHLKVSKSKNGMNDSKRDLCQIRRDDSDVNYNDFRGKFSEGDNNHIEWKER